MVALTGSEGTSLVVEKTRSVAAPLGVVFDSLLVQLGPGAVGGGGEPMPMVFEAWPGGRWFRDLGGDAGHWWGTVQVIKPPTLIEINGPLFMSYPVVSHIAYRLGEEGEGTVLSLRHLAIGMIDQEHASGIDAGWGDYLERVAERAESV